jgi:hypothetical protein
MFEDALDEEAPSDKNKKSKSSSNKVGWKLSRFRSKEAKSGKNGNGESPESGSGQMSLPENLEEAHLAVEMFLNNNFDEARSIVQPL